MRFGQLLLGSGLALAMALPCSAMIRARRGPTAHHQTSHSRTHHKIKHVIGQRSIDDARATQIQSALVNSGYLSNPSGHWDAQTSAAMQKYQSDNGWQTKLVPDSRAIIKLGLGPERDSARAAAASTLGTTESASTSGVPVTQ